MWWMHDGGMGWWIFGAVWMTFFWLVVIALVFWAISRITGDRGRDGESALEIARKRYARGEITQEQFEQLRRDLS